MTAPPEGSAPALLDLGVPLDSPRSGPKPTQTLLRRASPLASTKEQLRVLASLPLEGPGPADFDRDVARHGFDPLRPGKLEIFQINLGKLCNMTCRHCHVDAGPDRFDAMMSSETVEECLAALDRCDAHTVDITGGAPELHPQFRRLVEEAVRRGRHVIDRCNLTILLVPRMSDLPEWFAERGVEVVCSLPHWRRSRTDAQRGEGAFERSIEALRRLNAAGYGRGDARRRLTLMSNPAGAYLSGGAPTMEAEWKAGLLREHGVAFDRLIALNNMPISRFLEWLLESGNLQAYMQMLVREFNPAAIGGLMCRNTISIGWDGRIHDCDFNQMLDLEVDLPSPHIRDFDPASFGARRIRTARHCYGCTAGAGSSCGGATT